MKQNRNKRLGLMEDKNVISVTPPGAKVLGKLSVPGLPTLVWMIVGQGPLRFSRCGWAYWACSSAGSASTDLRRILFFIFIFFSFFFLLRTEV